MTSYQEFLEQKKHCTEYGFEPLSMPDYLFDFQQAIVDWAVRLGRCAIFADCGMGKTPMQLVWADNVVRKTGKKVIIVAPLAVSYQTIREGEKFGIEVSRSSDGEPSGNITITNYERLHLFNSSDYVGAVCDESSAIKSFNGIRRAIVTDFVRKYQYRLLCTATAAPNDYIELGTSSEALGYLDRTDMISRFFKNDERTSLVAHAKWTGQNGGKQIGWRLKAHAIDPFWKFIASWARAIRKPSDYGFQDRDFHLPPLHEINHIIESQKTLPGMLFNFDAVGLAEERDEQRLTIDERCNKAAELTNNYDGPTVLWCNLNEEAKLLKKIIRESVEISGSDDEDKKESAFRAFSNGEIKNLITKPKIGAFGLNWQHCNHEIYFPSHSYEQYYQAVRRCWRFGQTKPVTIDIVSTKSCANVIESLKFKSIKASEMFDKLVMFMNDAMALNKRSYEPMKAEVPRWIASNE